MNKFEKLIELIIEGEDSKARELFHTIVVEKSRDIYESMVSEEGFGDDDRSKVDELVSSVGADEEGVREDDEDDFSLDGEEPADDGEIGGELDGGEFGGEPEGEFGEESLEDQVLDLKSEFDSLSAKFEKIVAGEKHEEENDPDVHGGALDSLEGDDDEFGSDDFGPEPAEEGMQMEASGNPFAKKGSGSGSGSGAKKGSGSGAKGSGSGVGSGSGKKGSGKMESRKGTAELMREYVDKIGEIYGGPGDATEGTAVGTGNKTGKTNVNTKPGSIGPGADFGGNVVKTDTKETNQDGTSPTKASNEYNKGQTEQPLSKKQGGFKNKVGGNTPWNQGGDGGHGAEKNGDSESGKTVGTGKSDKASVNKKSEIGGKIR